MTTARCKIVDLDVTRYYHCISRCVRGAFLCGDGHEHRKKWLEDRLELLTKCFAVSVAGFAIMDNHLHLLIRMDPERAKKWTVEEVIVRWLSIYPPRGIDFDDAASVKAWVEHYSQCSKKLEIIRNRLANMGWFMKALKEPLSRMANKEDGCRGAFWEGRFKSIAILDEEALLATCAYIDLNPLAAGIATTPESSRFTSVRQRVKHVVAKAKTQLLRSAKLGSVQASRRIGNTEQDHWLLPIEDRRPHTHSKPACEREGMIEKFTLGSYLLLVESTGRLVRNGKARIADNVKQIFDRLNTNFEIWAHQVQSMLATKRTRGHRFAASQ